MATRFENDHILSYVVWEVHNESKFDNPDHNLDLKYMF